jgi:hypothetical protein
VRRPAGDRDEAEADQHDAEGEELPADGNEWTSPPVALLRKKMMRFARND